MLHRNKEVEQCSLRSEVGVPRGVIGSRRPFPGLLRGSDAVGTGENECHVLLLRWSVWEHAGAHLRRDGVSESETLCEMMCHETGRARG